jgi:hypothetical protein
MDTTALWAHPESIEKAPVTFINKRGKEVPRKKKVNGKMEIVYGTYTTCKYGKGDLVKEDDVISHMGSHKEATIEVEQEYLADLDKTLTICKDVQATVNTIYKARTQGVFNITYPKLVRWIQMFEATHTKKEKHALRWRNTHKDAIDRIYLEHGDDVGALPTEVEDSTTMSDNQLWTLRKMTYFAKALRNKVHITGNKKVNGVQYSFPSRTWFTDKAVYTMFKNMLTGEKKGNIEFSNDEEREYWNDMCEIRETHHKIQYRLFLQKSIEATRQQTCIQELATITCEEVSETVYD